MVDYVDVYTRLKMNTNKKIIITYYSSYGYKETKEVILKDVVGFKYIVVNDDIGETSIPFFGIDAMIESIIFKDSGTKIFNNPYVSKEIFDGLYIKEGISENIRQRLFGGVDINLEDRENFIQRYKAKESTFDYDDLFFSEKQKQEFKTFFGLLLKELIQYCEDNGLDTTFKLIGKGTTSIIYSIGDKIIKIGKPRRKSTIPYCEYLLQPIINRDFEFDGYPIHIEVTQKVIVCENIRESWSNEQFRAIRDELAERIHAIGLKSNDLHPGNIGILTDENKIHFNSIKFDIGNDFATSIQNNNNLKIKGKGEFVIIDLDCLEIEDMVKYSNYLRSLGYTDDQIINIEQDIYSNKR